jgi:hypothetical protein
MLPTMHIHPPHRPPRVARDREAFVLSIALILVSLIRLVPAVVRHETWGAEATIALIVLCLGLIGLPLSRVRR